MSALPPSVVAVERQALEVSMTHEDSRPPVESRDFAASIHQPPGRPCLSIASRRFLVFDGDGSLVASFASWDAAHAWSHLRAAEPLTRLPVTIEDRYDDGGGDRRTWVVEPGSCRLTLWTRRAEYPLCAPAALGANAG